ncbi:CsiV family protein [Gilvimarinus algae]|uniref:CsiV family protein n=1 Tax=Gilvimarinus algae TaxID=3058037 RepID=A0ABT8TL47_9GAMM|nr:CsiV family protein [Gilvimarinus sp. SDUM040014]MDO3384204.1 CsiV family protein [Gilvimarinus sp. SDUM040014]
MAALQKRPLTALLAMAALLVGKAQAQNEGHEGWYQIEMMVYARPLDASPEVWPQDIVLDYPLNWNHLRDPNEEYEKRRQRALEQAEAQNAVGSATGLDNQSATGELASDTPADEPLEVAPVDLARSAFYRLPETARGLNAVRQRIQAQPGYRVLFHEAWRQNVVSEKNAPWVLIEGGESYGEHRELEGSVNINVSRYLHLISDLWFSEFQINAGQIRSQWPPLPENPLKRLEQAQAGDNVSTQYGDDGFGGDGFGANDPAVQNMTGWQGTETDELLPDFLAAPYLPTRIVTLQQRRRMRSSELHHLDHPRLGLLIKITPYKLPPPEQPEADNTPRENPAGSASLLQ